MKFQKHPRAPHKYTAEDIDSGYRYVINKPAGGSWELTIYAGVMPADLVFADTKRELVETAQRHNARLWIDNMDRLHGRPRA